MTATGRPTSSRQRGHLPPHHRITAESDAVCVSVDYRLAPETPAPGPVDDCDAALHWLVARTSASTASASASAG